MKYMYYIVIYYKDGNKYVRFSSDNFNEIKLWFNICLDEYKEAKDIDSFSLVTKIMH